MWRTSSPTTAPPPPYYVQVGSQASGLSRGRFTPKAREICNQLGSLRLLAAIRAVPHFSYQYHRSRSHQRCHHGISDSRMYCQQQASQNGQAGQYIWWSRCATVPPQRGQAVAGACMNRCCFSIYQ
jgi:hypothetical protein